jgi:glucokinase
MEIGHLVVQPQGLLCGCGHRGCLETVGSRLAIASAAALAAHRGNAPWLMEHTGGEIANIRSGVLAKAIEAGDAVVEEIVREAARWVGMGVCALVHLLVPDVVVLGGGLVEAMPELYRTEVEQTARENVIGVYRKAFAVETAELGDDAAVLGAAGWVEHMVNTGPAE